MSELRKDPPRSSVRQFKRKLRTWIERNSSMSHVAGLVGMPTVALMRMLRSDAIPPTETLDRLQAVLKLPLAALQSAAVGDQPVRKTRTRRQRQENRPEELRRRAFASPAASATERPLKLYANRKLYDPATGRYVTMADVLGLTRAGYDIGVVDHLTGADVTTAILARAIGFEERRAPGLLPANGLRRVIVEGIDSLES